MKYVVSLACLFLLSVVPVQAQEPPAFDPDQPFDEAIERRALESLFGLALQELEDHFEISGNLNLDEGGGHGNRRLQFKFYPDGKSKSDRYVAAEGWFGPSGDPGRQELHFRFSVPQVSATPHYDENVL